MINFRKRRGFSLIELLIVIAIILIIITIAVPNLTRARMHAMETAAIAAIKTVHTAQVQYYSTYGRYATSLTELGPPASGTANASAADVIGNDLSNGKKQGYIFNLTGTPGGYILTANPENFGTTGSKTYYSDQTMVVHVNEGPEPATATSKEMR